MTSYQLLNVTTSHTITASFASYPDWIFPSNSLAFWIAADKLAANDGGRVGTWHDFSGHTGTMYQATLPSQPEFKTNVINGKPVVRFDGVRAMTNDALHADWPMSNTTVYVVFKAASPAQNYFYRAMPDDSANRFLTHLPWSGPTVYFDFGNTTAGRVQTAFDGGTDAHIWSMRSEYGVGQDLWRDAISKVSDISGISFNPAGKTFEIGTQVNGDIAEILIFNEALDFADNQRVGHYLQTKYGISGDYIDPHQVDLQMAIETDAFYPAPSVDQFTYTLTVTNIGPTNASGVAVSDPLPAGITYVSDDSGGDYNDTTGVWVIGGLAYQASTTLVLTVSQDAGTGDQVITNTATVSAAETDWEASNDSASVSHRANHESLTPGDYLRRMKITFPGYTKDETLTNFPALVKLDESLVGFRYRDFASGAGGDLRFAAADGLTALGYEVEEWNAGGTSYVWVKLRELAVGTHIWAYWGNASGATAPAYTTNGLAWNAGYEAVYHLAQSGTNVLDATANDYHGVTNNGVVQGSEGRISSGYEFDGTDDYVACDPRIFNSIPASFSVEWWLKPATAINWNQKMRAAGGEWNRWLFHANVSGSVSVGTRNNVASRIDVANAITNVNEWMHWGFTLDNGVARLYKDGIQLGEKLASDLSTASWNGFWMGRENTDTLDGTLDEVRISNVGWSSNWVWASVMNQDPATYGSFVAFDEALGAPVIENRQAIDISRTAGTMRGYLSATGGVPTSVWLYWGETDGLGDRAAWSNTNGPAANHVVGLITNRVTTLQPSKTYQYRYFASNVYGMAWATPTTNFATAASNEYAITAVAGDFGSVVPSGTEFVTNGANSSVYNFFPDGGYEITNVFVDGTSVGTPGSYQLLNVQTDHTVAVYFGIQQHDIAITQAVGGVIAPATHAPIENGSTSQVFTITADTEYYLHDLVVDGASQGQLYTYQFTNVTNDHSITAVFNAVPALPVTNGVVLWLDADTLNATNGQGVAWWQDLSGLDHHVEQSTVVERPVLVANAVNGVRPSVYFPAAADAHMLRSDALGFGADPAMSVIVVAKGPNSDGHRYLHLGDSAGGGGKIISFCTDAAVRYNDGNRIMNQRQQGSYSIGVWTRNAGDDHVDPLYWQNGMVGTQRSGDNTPPNLVGLEDEETLIGRGRSGTGDIADELDGHIAELIVFNRAITAEEQRQIGRYLGVKYDIGTGYGTEFLPGGVDDPVLWLSAEAMYNVTNGQKIAAWEDLSGNGRRVTQGTAAYQPVYVEGAFNGLPALRFDAGDDRLSRGDALGFTGDPAITVFFVAKGPDEDENRFFQIGDSAGAGGRVLSYGAEVAIRYNNGNKIWANDRITGRFAIGAITRNGGDTYLSPMFYKNGILATSTGGGADSTLAGLQNERTWVGAGWDGSGDLNHTLKGDLAELLVYNRVLNATERQAVGEYLTNKYKMRSTLFQIR